MTTSASVEITAPQGFWESAADFWTRIEQALYAGSDYLGQMEQYNVAARTAVDTGALQSDISYEAGTSHGDDLAFIYADTAEQEAEWGREYDVYQEGGALGLSTYTNSPREMFAKILTDDLDAIEQWGVDAIQGKLDAIAGGNG